MSQEASNRQNIIETVTKYAWGFDENDFSLLGSVFAAEATSGGKVVGTDISWGPMRGREEIVGGLQGMRNSQVDHRRHCLTNFHFISVNETAATVQCYMTLLSAGDGKLSPVTMGTFDADLVKGADSRWLITRLDISLDTPF